jgi:hypothetical protein
MRLILPILLILVLSTATANADDPRQMFDRATAEFNLGHFKEAASMYEEIYKITLDPVLLYNIAQAHRLAGNLDQAIFFYKGYLRAQPQAKNRVEVKSRITELEDAISARKRSQERPPNSTAGVGPHVTTRPPNATPEPSSPETTPPSQPQPSEPAPPPATTAPHETTTPPPAQTSETQPPPSEGKPLYKKWWFWTAVGGAVVVAAVVIGVSVAETRPARSFNANLPEIGPGPHTAARVAPLAEVSF